jgi:hypothetical protein
MGAWRVQPGQDQPAAGLARIAVLENEEFDAGRLLFGLGAEAALPGEKRFRPGRIAVALLGEGGPGQGKQWKKQGKKAEAAH